MAWFARHRRKISKKIFRYFNGSVSEGFVNKEIKFWDTVRNFMKEKGFLEVETPTLEVTTGGAEATPFKTYNEDFKLPLYLRISVGELLAKTPNGGRFSKNF